VSGARQIGQERKQFALCWPLRGKIHSPWSSRSTRL